jgi:hypothetical protein
MFGRQNRGTIFRTERYLGLIDLPLSFGYLSLLIKLSEPKLLSREISYD